MNKNMDLLPKIIEKGIENKKSSFPLFIDVRNSDDKIGFFSNFLENKPEVAIKEKSFGTPYRIDNHFSLILDYNSLFG
jgi:hypothetical protein